MLGHCVGTVFLIEFLTLPQKALLKGGIDVSTPLPCPLAQGFPILKKGVALLRACVFLWPKGGGQSEPRDLGWRARVGMASQARCLASLLSSVLMLHKLREVNVQLWFLRPAPWGLLKPRPTPRSCRSPFVGRSLGAVYMVLWYPVSPDPLRVCAPFLASTQQAFVEGSW